MHALAIEGTFDDCQAIVKGLFNHHAFRDRVRLSGVNSINWARIVAQVVYYFTAAVALGAPHRKVAFTVPTGNFGDVFAGYVASRMGLPIERLVVATNVNDILVRTLQDRHLRGARRDADHVALDGHPGLLEFRAPAVRCLWPRCRAGARADGLARAIAAVSSSRRDALTEIRSHFTAERADEDETAATIRTVQRETGYLLDPHTAVAVAVAEKESRDPLGADDRALDRSSGEIPGCGRSGLRHAPGLPDWLADLDTRPERVSVLPSDQGAVEKFILAASRAAREGAAA